MTPPAILPDAVQKPHGQVASGSQISTANGKQRANFSLGDSKCVLVNETIRCTPIVVASN